MENSLVAVAVASLPAGCFNPYSGVKTAILILDKSIAKQSATVAFFKVENDGFGLGAQCRASEKNNLPPVAAELGAYLQALRGRQSVADLTPTLGLIVPKEKIAANGDYNLSGERYREKAGNNHTFPLVSLGEDNLFRVESGGTPKSDVGEYWGGRIPWATLVDLPATDFISEITTTKRTISEKGLRDSSAKIKFLDEEIPADAARRCRHGDIYLQRGNTKELVGTAAIFDVDEENNIYPDLMIRIRADETKVRSYYLLAVLQSDPVREFVIRNAVGAAGSMPKINQSIVESIPVPLPPSPLSKPSSPR